MFLHAETTAQPRLATYSKNGSVEHLFALIDLCKLIERHKNFILAGAKPKNRRSPWNTEELDMKFVRCSSYRTRLAESGSHT
jgi:hypothetical protein